MSHSCNASTLIFCVFVYAPVFTGVHVFVSTLLFCLVVHSNYTLYYVSGLSSQQAHLEIRFKTAINIELCGKKGKGSDFKIVLSGVGSNHN